MGQKYSQMRRARALRALLALLFTANLLLGCGALLLGETGQLAKELAFCGAAAFLANFSVLSAAVLLYNTVKSSRRPAGEYCLRLPAVYEFLPAAFWALSFLLMVVTALHFQEAKVYYLNTAFSLPKIAAVLCPALCGLTFYWYDASQVFFSEDGIYIRKPLYHSLALHWSEVASITIRAKRRGKQTAYMVTIRSKQSAFRTICSAKYVPGTWRRFEQILQEAVRTKRIPVERI